MNEIDALYQRVMDHAIALFTARPEMVLKGYSVVLTPPPATDPKARRHLASVNKMVALQAQQEAGKTQRAYLTLASAARDAQAALDHRTIGEDGHAEAYAATAVATLEQYEAM